MYRCLERPDLLLEGPAVLDKPTDLSVDGPLWAIYLFWASSCANGQTLSPSW